MFTGAIIFIILGRERAEDKNLSKLFPKVSKRVSA